MAFPEWFIPKMKDIGYEQTFIHFEPETTWIKFKDNSDEFGVVYVKKELDPIHIKGLFDNTEFPVLFVVDLDLTTQLKIDVALKKQYPFWLRALHAIYYGRIYTWNGHNIRALHVDSAKSDFAFSEIIDVTGILFTRTDCQLRDFPGTFFIARFYDRAFWKEQSKPPPKQKSESWKERARKQREEWEQATTEDIYEAFKRAFREHMNNYNAYSEPPRTRYNARTDDKWLSILMATSSIEAARKKFKELAKQYHPDLNPGDATALATMQEISNAFDKVKEYLK